MDEKTAELRDIFIEATGEDTVTENQEESRGSLTDGEDAEGRVVELVATMRERYGFGTDLGNEALAGVVRGYFEDASDEEIAADLGVDRGTVRRARLELHLVDEADRDAPFEFDRLREMVVEGVPVEERADRLGVDVETVERYTRVVEADRRSTRANDRFRDEFAELLTDSELSDRLASDAREDGLEEATEDIETDVSF